MNAPPLSLDGRRMLTTSNDATARLWTANAQSAPFGSELSYFDAGQPITAAALSHDGQRVVLSAGTWDADPARSRGEVQIWQVAD